MPRMLPLLLVLATAPGLAPAAAPPPGKVDFTRDVRPILQRACVTCHGAEKQRGGLRLDDGTLALRGGNSGAVLKPGDAAHSHLLARVTSTDPDTKMPPGKRKPLSAAEVALLRAWVDQGAQWPKGTGPVVK